MNKGLYPIRAVSRLTGVSPDNIRAWERRYGAVVPQRVKGGRLFSEADLTRLRLLKRAVDHGHSIGQIARLSNDMLEKLPIKKGDILPQNEQTTSPRDQEIKTVFRLLQGYEVLEAERSLNRLASFLSPHQLIHEAVIPLMQMVGDSWRDKSLTIAQEHIASSILRSMLGTLIRLYGREDTPRKLMFATPSGELHEFGILSAAMLAAAGGLGTLYVGPDLPAEELAEATRKTQVAAVVLGVAIEADKVDFLKDYLARVQESLPNRVELMVGGKLEEEMQAFMNERGIVHFGNLQQYEVYIRKFGALF